MKSRAGRFALAIGLALAPKSRADEPPPRKAQSITFSPVTPKVYRDPDFTLDASASSGLDVSFTASGDCAVKDATVRILSAGKCWVTAHQVGDAEFEAAPDVEQMIPIAKSGQRIEGAAPAGKRYLDPDFPAGMYATSGLDVVLYASGDCAVEGSTVHILGAGSCALEAHQPGDSNYLAARIVEQRFPIAKADQAIEFAEFSNRRHGPDDVRLSARASSSLPVFFRAAGPCRVVGSYLRILDSGECSVTAEQPGSRDFHAAPPVTRTLRVVGPPPPPTPP